MKNEKTSGQQKENKLVKIIIAILIVIIILLLLRSCAKRTPLTVKLSEDWFYSDDITTDVINNIMSVDGYTLNHDGEVYISESNSVVYREGDYEFEFVAKYGDVVVTVTDGNNAGQAECLVLKGVEWYLTTNDEGEDIIETKELYYSSTPTPTNGDNNASPAPATPSTPSTPSNPTDGGNNGGESGGESGSGDSDQPAQKPVQVELGGSLNNDHQVIVGGDDQPSGGSGDNGTGNGGSNNGSTSGNNGGTIVTIPDEDVTGTIKGENNISNNPSLSHEETSLGDRVVSKPATPAPADTPAAPADNGGSNNTSTDAGKPADGGASKPAPAPTPQPQPENPPVVVEAPAPADNNPAPADDAPAPSTDPNVVCDENGDCKIVW